MRRAIGTVVVFVAALLAPVCETGGPGSSDTVTLSVQHVNADVQPIHLFGQGETFPCCQVVAGASRTREYSIARGTSLVFRAGRNGEIVGSISCTVDLASSGDTATVTWTGAGLGCTGRW